MSSREHFSIRRVAVYCGSSAGVHHDYLAAATETGRILAERGLELVYGGGHVGLMGAVANGALAGGGVVHGIITSALLDAEVGHTGLTSLEVVSTMHERKARMATWRMRSWRYPEASGLSTNSAKC